MGWSVMPVDGYCSRCALALRSTLDLNYPNTGCITDHHTATSTAIQDVKISAAEIVENLHYPNGTAMIPPGSVVYISTDDPDGLCKGCMVNRQSCNTYQTPKPPGCPEDVSAHFCVDVLEMGLCLLLSDHAKMWVAAS
jgi:hypothetical protein